MRTTTVRGRLPVWAYGIAALVTAMAVVVGAVWFAVGRTPDGGHDAVPRAVSVPAPSPSVSASAPGGQAPRVSSSPSPSPSTLPEVAASIEADRAADRAAAGNAGLAAEDSLAAPPAAGAAATDADRVAAHDWLTTALNWRTTDLDHGPWTLAAERATAKHGSEDLQYVVAAATALERIAYDALAHDAPPKIVEITDETNAEWDAPDSVTLRAAVVFGTGDGWVRPGMRLLVNFQVSDGVVTGVFIDEAYLSIDPELLP